MLLLGLECLFRGYNAGANSRFIKRDNMYYAFTRISRHDQIVYKAVVMINQPLWLP